MKSNILKKKHIIAFVCLFACISHGKAQEEFRHYLPKYYVGIHTGFDYGAAIPTASDGMGEGARMNLSPHLFPQIGVRGGVNFNRRWSAGMEATYKESGMDVKMWVGEQNFRDVADPDRYLKFRGTLGIDMDFAMLEVPVYVGFSVFPGTDRIILGGYYSHMFKSHFESNPQKGLLININDPEDYTNVTPEGEPVTYNFDKGLDSWDFGFLIGYELKIVNRLKASARFYMGAKDIFKPGEKYLDYKMVQIRGGVVLSYDLFRWL